jgi:SAM-dependent methyltransferase
MQDQDTSPLGPIDLPTKGLDRYRSLFRLWRNEVAEPEALYVSLAREEARDLDARYGLNGTRVLDLGCGPGYYTQELRRRGAITLGVDLDSEGWSETEGGQAIGDAAHLPFPDNSFDGIFCSNLLEHAPDTRGVFVEAARLLRPGGWIYMSWTNWYSPWGGHAMSPYHFLGPSLGPRLYERFHGLPDKNRMGEGLFAVHIGSTLRLIQGLNAFEIEEVVPRYWPWAAWITKVPVLREVITWNCVIRLRTTS